MSRIKIFITGSRGIVGRHLCAALTSQTHIEVYEFDGDIRDRNDIDAAVTRAGDIDIVINLAAVVAVETVENDPAKAYSVNVGGVTSLLEVISGKKIRPYFFQCSSAHVYSPSEHAISEDDATEPLSYYGKTKRMAEIVVEDVCNKLDLPWGIGRVFSIHDPAQKGSFLRPRIEERLRTGNLGSPFELRGADSVRDFLPAKQAAEYILALSLSKHQGIINIGSGEPTRIRDFVQQLSSEKLDVLHVGNSDMLLANVTRLRNFERNNGATDL